MSVRVEPTSDGRVGVLRGLDSDVALHHLAHSLLVGVAFADRRGLVIDLGGCRPSAETTDLLRDATHARLRRHQVVTAVPDAREVAREVSRVRRWLDRVDHSGTDIPSMLKADLSSLRSLGEVALSIARSLINNVVHYRPAS